MKRSIILSAVAVALLVSAPAWAAAPFGSFGGKVGGGNSGAGMLPLHGWALDDSGIASVDILVDGIVAGRAHYGRSRPGVLQRYPSFPNAATSGFAWQLDTTHYLNGTHTVTARVKSNTGEVVTLEPRVFLFHNLEHNLAPFGKIEFPQSNGELRGNCDLADPSRRYSVISGYALDAGTREDDTGVGYVELMIDRAIWANSQIDCRYSLDEGGLSDCYGLRRLDVERIFPSLKDSPHSGFRFVLDIGVLVNFFGYTPGSHILTIRAGDHADQVRNIAEIPVTFSCDQDLGNENSIGDIDLPVPGVLLGNVVTATGWALDWEGVSGVRILVDGRDIGFATFGIIPRDEVNLLYPGYPDSLAPGWQFALDTRTLSNGQHFLEAIVVDSLGAETHIGKRRIVVRNPRP
jgi:N-acetylmuramoyl-L-alanine amidase